jgi:hypothetical protein
MQRELCAVWPAAFDNTRVYVPTFDVCWVIHQQLTHLLDVSEVFFGAKHCPVPFWVFFPEASYVIAVLDLDPGTIGEYGHKGRVTKVPHHTWRDVETGGTA